MNKKTMNKIILLSALTLSPGVAKADLFKCNACPAGYRCDGTSKYICDAGTYSQAGASSCSPCPAGTYSQAGASSCGFVCLKNDYTILEAYASMKNLSTSCETSFFNNIFPVGTKADDQYYKPEKYSYFTPSRGGCKVTTIDKPVPYNPGVVMHDYYANYSGITYTAIKFHYNSDKNKIEVITNTNSVIAELEATMCE